jgi:hypothetical protein
MQKRVCILAMLDRAVPAGHGRWTGRRQWILAWRMMKHALRQTGPAESGGASLPHRSHHADKRGNPGKTRSLCRLPDGRGRHPTANVPGDYAITSVRKILKWRLSVLKNCKYDVACTNAFRSSCEHQRVTMQLNKNAVLSGEYLVSPLVKALRH